MSVKEAARLLGVSTRTVDRLIEVGELSVIRIRGQRRLEQPEIRRYIEAQRGITEGTHGKRLRLLREQRQ